MCVTHSTNDAQNVPNMEVSPTHTQGWKNLRVFSIYEIQSLRCNFMI